MRNDEPPVDSAYLHSPDAKGHLKVLEVLRKWDPIGVIDERNQDEYDSYAPTLIKMLDANCSEGEIVKWMGWLASEYMGLGTYSRKHTVACVQELHTFWRECKRL